MSAAAVHQVACRSRGACVAAWVAVAPTTQANELDANLTHDTASDWAPATLAAKSL